MTIFIYFQILIMLVLFQRPFSGQAARLLGFAALRHPLVTADFSYLYGTFSFTFNTIFRNRWNIMFMMFIVKYPMLRQHHKIVLLLASFHLLYYIQYFIYLNIFPIKSKLRNMIISKVISKKLYSSLQNRQFISQTRRKNSK